MDVLDALHPKVYASLRSENRCRDDDSDAPGRCRVPIGESSECSMRLRNETDLLSGLYRPTPELVANMSEARHTYRWVLDPGRSLRT